jgi:hypothetical protein
VASEELAQRFERPVGELVGHEFIGRRARVAVDLGFAVAAAPDQIRLDADHRIAPARFAALDAFHQEGVVAAFGEFQECGNRRFEIGDQPRVKRLRAARIVSARECLQNRVPSIAHDPPPIT